MGTAGRVFLRRGWDNRAGVHVVIAPMSDAGTWPLDGRHEDWSFRQTKVLVGDNRYFRGPLHQRNCDLDRLSRKRRPAFRAVVGGSLERDDCAERRVGDADILRVELKR
jgi:hypothetical protein